MTPARFTFLNVTGSTKNHRQQRILARREKKDNYMLVGQPGKRAKKGI